jgi:hypothetical protein
MQIKMLNAEWAAQTKPYPLPPIPPAPPLTVASFAPQPVGLGGIAPIIPSEMPAYPAAYAPIPVATSSFLWDAITVGYGIMPNLHALVGPAYASGLRKLAAARAFFIRAAYMFPALTGPRLRPYYSEIEASEKRIISFLLGQTMALRLSKVIWEPIGVKRLLHRSIYGPLLGIPPGFSPDYVSLIHTPAGYHIAAVEAKGFAKNFNPQTVASDMAQLVNGFTQLSSLGALGIVPMHFAVSVASFDAAIGGDEFIGQFWDPPTERPTIIEPEAAGNLFREYFLRLFGFLNLFGTPKIDEIVPGVEAQVWDCALLKFKVGMQAEQFELLTQLARDNDMNALFLDWIQLQNFCEEILLGNPSWSRNADGLYLVSDEETESE